MKSLKEIKDTVKNILGITDVTDALESISDGSGVDTFLTDEINIQYQVRMPREFSYLDCFSRSVDKIVLKNKYTPIDNDDIIQAHKIYIDRFEGRLITPREMMTFRDGDTIKFRPNNSIQFNGVVPYYRSIIILTMDNRKIATVNEDLELLDVNNDVIGSIVTDDLGWTIKTTNFVGDHIAMFNIVQIGQLSLYIDRNDGIEFSNATSETKKIVVSGVIKPQPLRRDNDRTVLPMTELDTYLAYAVAISIAHRIDTISTIAILQEGLDQQRAKINEAIL